MNKFIIQSMDIRLLVVDDASFIREIISKIAQTKNWEVVGEAENGEVAVEKARELKPNLIIMDIIMPVKSGLIATKEILNFLPDCKIIACTTEAHETMVIKALEAGCVDIVTKPFLMENIIKVVEKIFQRKEING